MNNRLLEKNKKSKKNVAGYFGLLPRDILVLFFNMLDKEILNFFRRINHFFKYQSEEIFYKRRIENISQLIGKQLCNNNIQNGSLKVIYQALSQELDGQIMLLKTRSTGDFKAALEDIRNIQLILLDEYLMSRLTFADVVNICLLHADQSFAVVAKLLNHQRITSLVSNLKGSPDFRMLAVINPYIDEVSASVLLCFIHFDRIPVITREFLKKIGELKENSKAFIKIIDQIGYLKFSDLDSNLSVTRILLNNILNYLSYGTASAKNTLEIFLKHPLTRAYLTEENIDRWVDDNPKRASFILNRPSLISIYTESFFLKLKEISGELATEGTPDLNNNNSKNRSTSS